MGRELRMVPADWKHPKYNGKYEPLYDGFSDVLAQLEAAIAEKGLREALYHNHVPMEDNYMLVDVPDSDRTHFMMYEDTSEGTPISPAFETAEALAHWLADTGASAFARDSASYEGWLATIKSGWAVSAMVTLTEDGAIIQSGVEAWKDDDE